MEPSDDHVGSVPCSIWKHDLFCHPALCTLPHGTGPWPGRVGWVTRSNELQGSMCFSSRAPAST